MCTCSPNITSPSTPSAPTFFRQLRTAADWFTRNRVWLELFCRLALSAGGSSHGSMPAVCSPHAFPPPHAEVRVFLV